MRPTTCRYCKHQFHITEDIREHWKQNKLQCPGCSILYCVLPKTERSLRLLQDEFIKGKDEKVLNEMYFILMDYTKSLFLKSFSNITTDQDTINYYIQNAISFLLEDYYSKENHEITVSFGGMIIYKIKQAIFSKSEYISDNSLDFQLEDGNFAQIEDSKCYFEVIEKECDNLILKNHINKLLIKIGDYSDSPYENYMRELGLSLHLTRGEKYADQLYIQYNREGKLIYMYTLDVLQKELQKAVVMS